MGVCILCHPGMRSATARIVAKNQPKLLHDPARRSHCRALPVRLALSSGARPHKPQLALATVWGYHVTGNQACFHSEEGARPPVHFFRATRSIVAHVYTMAHCLSACFHSIEAVLAETTIPPGTHQHDRIPASAARQEQVSVARLLASCGMTACQSQHSMPTGARSPCQS